MGLNKTTRSLDFANCALATCLEQNRSIKFCRDLEPYWTVRNDTPNFGLKEHTAVDANHGFVLATTLTPASVKDTNYLSYCTAFSRHTQRKIKKVYPGKGYSGKPNRNFLAFSQVEDGIIRNDSTTAKLTELEILLNKAIFKIRYIACPAPCQDIEALRSNVVIISEEFGSTMQFM